MTSVNLLDLLDLPTHILEACKAYGVGRRKLDDPLFKDDKPLRRLGVYDLDDESLCHEVVTTTCSVPGCVFSAENLLDFESHYNSCHRYSCATCKKILPSPHLLDLHIQENHDSYFAVMAEKKPSFCCYIEECKEKFENQNKRKDHCIKIHKLPKDFRFDYKKPRPIKNLKVHNKSKAKGSDPMVLDNKTTNKSVFVLSTSKSKAFPKYTGKKFTGNNRKSVVAKDIDMGGIVDDLKVNLPT